MTQASPGDGAPAPPATSGRVSHQDTLETARFEPCPVDPRCAYCGDGADPGAAPRWPFVDAVYCISLASRDDRARLAARELHRVGLCRQTIFYRPRGGWGSTARRIWNSHQIVAQAALRRGSARTLVLEDDCVFDRNFGEREHAAIAQALDRLPPDWMAFYLGHWPLAGCFVAPDVLRVSSLCTHAYIASERLCRWIADHPYVPVRERRGNAFSILMGKGIDVHFSGLPDMYALYPMQAFQSRSPHDHRSGRRNRRESRLKQLKLRLRDHLLLEHMRTAETFAAWMSPPLRLALRLPGVRVQLSKRVKSSSTGSTASRSAEGIRRTASVTPISR